jgi:hypothetical protein
LHQQPSKAVASLVESEWRARPAETRLNQFERVLLSVQVDKSLKGQFEKSVHNHNVEAVILVVLVDPRFNVRFDFGDLCGLAFYDFGPHSRKLGVF